MEFRQTASLSLTNHLRHVIMPSEGDARSLTCDHMQVGIVSGVVIIILAAGMEASSIPVQPMLTRSLPNLETPGSY